MVSTTSPPTNCNSNLDAPVSFNKDKRYQVTMHGIIVAIKTATMGGYPERPTPLNEHMCSYIHIYIYTYIFSVSFRGIYAIGPSG